MAKNKKPLTLPGVNGRTAAGVTSIEEALRLKKPVTDSIVICLDGDAVDPVYEAKAALSEATQQAGLRAMQAAKAEFGDDADLVAVLQSADTSEDPEVLAAQAELDAAEAVKLSLSIEFVFRALGGTALEEMMAQYPATPKQISDHKAELRSHGESVKSERLPYDAVKFPPVLLATSCISPEMTLEQATELWNSDNWNKGERASLMQTAQSVNMIVR